MPQQPSAKKPKTLAQKLTDFSAYMDKSYDHTMMSFLNRQHAQY